MRPTTPPSASAAQPIGRRTGLASRTAAAIVLACGLSAAAPARAHGLHEPISSAPTPPSPPGDGATAEKVIADVDAKVKDLDQRKPAGAAPSAKDALPALPGAEGRAAKVVAEPVRRAREALERARGARTSGDVKHAGELAGLALEWSEMARDLLRAVAAEDAAGAEQHKARKLEAQVERARALLAETQARRARAAAELDRAETEARDAAKAAADQEDARTAPGAKKQGGERRPGGAGKPAKAPAKKKVAK